MDFNLKRGLQKVLQSPFFRGKIKIGVTGFEPATSTSRT